MPQACALALQQVEERLGADVWRVFADHGVQWTAFQRIPVVNCAPEAPSIHHEYACRSCNQREPEDCVILGIVLGPRIQDSAACEKRRYPLGRVAESLFASRMDDDVWPIALDDDMTSLCLQADFLSHLKKFHVCDELGAGFAQEDLPIWGLVHLKALRDTFHGRCRGLEREEPVGPAGLGHPLVQVVRLPSPVGVFDGPLPF